MPMPKLRLLGIFAAIAAVVLALATIDLIREPELPPFEEIVLDLIEALVLVIAMAAVAWTVLSIRDLRNRQAVLSTELTRSLAEGEAWRKARRTEIAAFGEAIEDQFRRWQLTTAEIDIAGLILKGASLKDVARARATSEATIRQQAQSIYRKSGLSGRAEFSAYFLESLFDAAERQPQKSTQLSVVPTAGPLR
jgi:DNA-binding CsgD family transcriptional regulator